MPKVFNYVAMDATGNKHTGELELGSRPEAMRQLQSQGLRPVTIVEGALAKHRKTEKEALDEPVFLKNKDIIAFTEELSELLEAGLPLEPARLGLLSCLGWLVCWPDWPWLCCYLRTGWEGAGSIALDPWGQCSATPHKTLQKDHGRREQMGFVL